jgi:hypothetical protein
MNPDPNGEPWWSGDGVLPSAEEIAMVPELVLTAESENMLLPYKVYNDEHIFFPPIFYQEGSSCVHAAEIGYNFTYEINRARNVAAGVWIDPENREHLYHHLFTYNFVNKGVGSTYTSYMGGFKIIQENGCPSYEVYDDPALYTTDKFKYWMTDFENYNSGMSNQIFEYNYIYFNTAYSSLDNLKHWLADHGEGAGTGGLAVIAIYTSGWNPYSTIPSVSPEEPGEKMITQWGTENGHALSIVGYNDEIYCFDINGDGLYTMDVDVDNDGDVDLFDCEKGAFKIANSWGTGFGNGGFIFVPYKLMAEGLQWSNTSYICKSQGNYEPLLEINTSVEYPERNKLKFKVGYAQNANQTTPLDSKFYSSFRNQGGPYQMRGAYSGPIEIGLNYGYWYLSEDVGKIFLIIDENENSTPTNGTIEYMSIVDYRWNEEFELFCDETNVAIINNDETVLSIDYDLIVPGDNQYIIQDLNLFSNMVSRFTPTVDNNATLTVEDGIRVDMYNSEIHISGGSSLVLEDNVTFLAKTGSCKIFIDGNISVGSNVSFIAEDGAQLDVVLNNPDIQADFNNTLFEKTKLYNYAQNLIITNSTFNNCQWVFSFHGNIFVDNSNLNETWLYLENQLNDPSLIVSVTNCTITNINSHMGIDMWNYGKYFIENNDIMAHHNGILIQNCGNGNTGNQNISNNNIYNCGNAGILAYNTTGSIAQNHIHNNNTGIKLMNICNIALYGNPGAPSYDEMNYITDNVGYEIYISKYSFPWYFMYNAIIDEDNAGNPNDPLLYFAYPVGTKVNQKDIRYNCWGNNFTASEDLYPHPYFYYNPTWCPGGTSIETSVAEQMYIDGKDQFETQQYAQSKATFMLLIEQFPETEYAVSAMKELVVLEQFESNDYESLKNYYQTNDSIQADSILQKLALTLSNKCDVKLERWVEAIDYYESIVDNPETLEDSVFAIIDLGYVYFLMENSGYKSAYTGKLTQYKPESKEQFFDHRDYLLSLLPGENRSEPMKGNIAALKEGELLQNVPNPFRGNTQIWYKLENESTVQLNVYNYTGQLISSINEGTKTKGNHYIDFNANGLKSGIYFYSISINGQTTDSKKMTVME